MTEAWSAWPAPAKLNLFLHVVDRRPDGYHLLQTVFQLLDWGDTVHLRVRADSRIARSGDLAAIPEESDLTLRAARTLQESTGSPLGVEIAIEKRIPVGGGLGGGSSDAATTLVALNEMWQTGLGVDELADLGLRLGADVPLFVRGHSAWAEGVGERLVPVDLPYRNFVVVDPNVSIATGPLFQASELTRNTAPTTINAFLEGTATSNAFAPLVRARHPQVAEALDWLGRFGDARLSGTGGCVFLALESAAEAEKIVSACPAGFVAFSANGVNQSRLIAALDQYRSQRLA